jgi:crossover junction endodeoxyribonuclease RuvC
MRILGIDPGYAIVGYGVLEYDGYAFKPVTFGAITTQAGTPFELRLCDIYRDMQSIIESSKPDVMSMEKLYFTNNQKTGIDVAQARGVILLAAANMGLAVHEYTPLQVKQAVVGYGKAEKHQVMEMTRAILHLASVPKPDDTADALAIAICHGHYSQRKMYNE